MAGYRGSRVYSEREAEGFLKMYSQGWTATQLLACCHCHWPLPTDSPWSFSRTYPPAPAIKSPPPPHSPTFCLPPAFSPPRPRPAFPRAAPDNPPICGTQRIGAEDRLPGSQPAARPCSHAAMWWRCVMVFLHAGGEGDGELGAGTQAWTVDAGTLGHTEYLVHGILGIWPASYWPRPSVPVRLNGGAKQKGLARAHTAPPVVIGCGVAGSLGLSHDYDKTCTPSAETRFSAEGHCLGFILAGGHSAFASGRPDRVYPLHPRSVSVGSTCTPASARARCGGVGFCFKIYLCSYITCIDYARMLPLPLFIGHFTRGKGGACGGGPRGTP